MNTKELQKITTKDLYEITGGKDKDYTGIAEVLDKICVQIKEFLTS